MKWNNIYLCTLLCMVFVVLMLPGIAAAVPVQWKVSDGGNGHFYDVIKVPEGINWIDAKSEAIAKGGYLVTILSAAENQFIFENLVDNDYFWVSPDYPWHNQNVGPWIGAFQIPGAPEPDGDWTWVNYDGLLVNTYSNWLDGEPNDYGTGNENAALFYDNDRTNGPIRTSMWNDWPNSNETISYVIEYDSPFSYTPISPCRIVDTRKTSAGIIGASTPRNFRVFGSGGAINAQGGNPAGCPSPLGQPLAAHINMVAVNPTGKGNLQAFPVGAGTGAGLSVNYNTIDTNLANAGTVKTVTGTGADISVASNFSSAHTVIDVLGYYYPDEGLYYTPVDPCRIADTRKTSEGIIDAGKERDFRVFGPVGDQGGNPAGCLSTLGVSPEAAHLNMIAVDPAGKGNLQAFPADDGPGAGLSVNYNTIDTNLANAGTVKTVTGAGPDITVASNFSSAHTVIDVLGYYSEEKDLLYTPVIPCRIVDTRKTSAGIIGASTQRNFRVYGSGGTMSAQGGNSAGCSSPLGQPLAAHINMVAVNPTGKGNLQAFPVDAGTGAGLSVNYNTIDTNLANAGTVKTILGAGPDITVASNFSSAHTVIDVLGYYYPAP